MPDIGWSLGSEHRQVIEALQAENAKLRVALEAIKKATVDGRVCNDVAWFDGITTLYEYIDQVLNGNGHVVTVAHEQSGPSKEWCAAAAEREGALADSHGQDALTPEPRPDPSAD